MLDSELVRDFMTRHFPEMQGKLAALQSENANLKDRATDLEVECKDLATRLNELKSALEGIGGQTGVHDETLKELKRNLRIEGSIGVTVVSGAIAALLKWLGV